MKEHYFFAVSLPAFVKETLFQWRCQYENQLPFRTWVHKDDYHITLCFLGDAGESLPSLRKRMQNISVNSFSTSVQDIHTFGNSEKPRILWAGATCSKELLSLYKQVNSACEQSGFSIDKRPYQPHITIAKRYAGEQAFQKNRLDLDSITFSVESFSLFVTHLESTPKYEEIDTFPLTKFL